MEKRISGPGSSSYGQACMQCYKAKCRCVALSDSAGCERCLRLKKQCRPSESTRRRVYNSETGVQIAKLEGRIEALTSMLQSVVKTTGVSADPPPPLNEPLSTANTCNAVGAGLSPLGDAAPLHLGLFYGVGQAMYEPAPDESELYLGLFRSRMLPCFPFIFMPPSITAQELRRDRPYLFWAIIAVATPSTEQKVARVEKLKHALTRSIMLENQSSIDILLSILTYITWSSDPFLKRTNNLSRMMMLATSVVSDLQLVQLSPEACVIAKMAPGLGNSSRNASETSPQDLIDGQRAVLACFVLSSMMSSYFRQLDAIRWSPQMEEAVRIVGMNKECPSDEVFALQVRLQILQHEAAQLRGQQDLDCTHRISTAATQPAPAFLYLGVLQGQLQQLKASIPPIPQHMAAKMLSAHAHYVELCINEASHLASSNEPLLSTPDYTGGPCANGPRFERVECLWQCLQAVKSWLDVFYTVSPAAYVGFPFFYWFQLVRCIVILKHLSTVQHPDWDCQVVFKTVDMIALLEWMAEKAELAGNEASEQSDDNLFNQVSRMLRLSLEWIRAKQQAENHATEGFSSIRSDGSGLATPDDLPFTGQMAWMNAFEAGDETWLEEFFGWSPGTL